jgi:serine phosphatase RsbU (regulator of sigma subunit)
VEVIEASGTLLGIGPRPHFGRAKLWLAPGDALILYTDGATELRGDDRFRGERVLRETVAGVAGSSLAHVVEAIEHQALVAGGGELRDDLALLAIGAVRKGDQ